MVKPCVRCGSEFESVSPRAMFCGKKCRQNASLDRKRNLPAGPRLVAGDCRPTVDVMSTVGAVQAQLEAAARAETYLGASALRLAERIDQSTAVMGFAALVKELRSTMDAALAGVKVANDPVDEIRLRRERKHAG